MFIRMIFIWQKNTIKYFRYVLGISWGWIKYIPEPQNEYATSDPDKAFDEYLKKGH